MATKKHNRSHHIKKDPRQMNPQELRQFIDSQKPRRRLSEGEQGAWEAWVDMIRKCYDPTYPGYLNRDPDEDEGGHA